MKREVRLAASRCQPGAASATPVVSTFDDLTLPASGYFLPGASTSFVSGAASFNHSFTEYLPGYCLSGWTYSNRTDTTTPSSDNQYSAITGGGAGGSANHAVACLGDGFTKRFGGEDRPDPDFLRLTITGVNAAGEVKGSVDICLADLRFADSAQDYTTGPVVHREPGQLGHGSKPSLFAGLL